MKGPQYQYTKELYERFGYTATWTPAVSIKLGDVGIIGENIFRRVSSLKEMNIPFNVRRGKAQENLIYTSESGVSLNFKAVGSPIVNGGSPLVQKAGATIDFQKKAGIVFVAKDCLTTEIEDQIALKNELTRYYNLAQWDAKYYVITELKHAASMSVFISESSGGKIELFAENNLNLGTVSLADLDVGLSIGTSIGITTQIVASQNTTPLFIAKKLKVGWFSGMSFENNKDLHDIEKLPSEVEVTEENTELANFVPDF